MSSADGSSTRGVPSTAEGVDPARFRDLMSRVCSPVTIVTTADGDGPHGATASSFAGLSQDPPLVTVAFDRRSALLQRVLGTKRFGINLLGHGQDDLALLFATRGAERFANTSWHHASGLPRLNAVAGWVACNLYDAVEGGDHLLLIGLVTDTSKAELPPLVYAHRTFGTHSRYSERARRPIVDHIAACAS